LLVVFEGCAEAKGWDAISIDQQNIYTELDNGGERFTVRRKSIVSFIPS
jgi:hypothetical protein